MTYASSLEFQRPGFVLIDAQGRTYKRERAGVHKFSRDRWLARVWARYESADRYMRTRGLRHVCDVVHTRHASGSMNAVVS